MNPERFIELSGAISVSLLFGLMWREGAPLAVLAFITLGGVVLATIKLIAQRS
jgi:hypothetical protein